jgi:hypothetical protein
MTAVLTFAIIAAFGWAAFNYFSVSSALKESMPPEWRGTITERFAIESFALNPSTPPPIQTDYMASLVGGCLAVLFLTLLVFSVGETKGGWLFLAILALCVASTVKSAMKYWKNRKRAAIARE